MVLASGMPVAATARLLQANEDTVRGVINRFNEIGLGWSSRRHVDPGHQAHERLQYVHRPHQAADEGLPAGHHDV